MKGIDATGEVIKDPRNSFIGAAESGLNMKYNQSQFKLLFDYLSNGSGKITADDIKVVGVVITGDVNSINLLKGVSTSLTLLLSRNHFFICYRRNHHSSWV